MYVTNIVAISLVVSTLTAFGLAGFPDDEEDCRQAKEGDYCPLMIHLRGWYVLRVTYCKDQHTRTSETILITQKRTVHPLANTVVSLKALGGRKTGIFMSPYAPVCRRRSVMEAPSISFNSSSSTPTPISDPDVVCEGTSIIGFRCVYKLNLRNP